MTERQGTVHMDSKVVTRYEVWCDLCDFLKEYSDPTEARDRQLDHVAHHVELGDDRGG